MNKQLFFSFIILICLPWSVIAQLDAEFDKLFTDLQTSEPGGSVMVLKGDKVVYEKSIGVSDIETMKKIDLHTVFNTGSISKTVVAYGILVLEEMGLLSTEDSILKHFPDFDNPDVVKDVKIKHLLSHSSGLPDLRDVGNNEEFFMTAKDNENFEPLKKVEHLKFQPGTGFEYSNPAFNGLALIIEKVSGMKWQKFIQEKIFDPAGMNESYITDGSFPDSGVAHAYVKDGKHWKEYDYGEYSTFTAAGNGGVWCSIQDLVKYYNAIEMNSFLSSDGIKKSQTIVNKKNRTTRDYSMSMSWFMRFDKELDKTIISHTGSQGGFMSFYYRIPEEDVLYMALFNRPVDNFFEKVYGGFKILKANKWMN